MANCSYLLRLSRDDSSPLRIAVVPERLPSAAACYSIRAIVVSAFSLRSSMEAKHVDSIARRSCVCYSLDPVGKSYPQFESDDFSRLATAS